MEWSGVEEVINCVAMLSYINQEGEERLEEGEGEIGKPSVKVQP